jgi:indole-3-glycerol phosphate synthase
VFLDDIAAATRRRVARAKESLPPAALKDRVAAAYGGASGRNAFEEAVAGPGLSLICEVKKASPSRGLIAEDFPYKEIACEYEAAGAAAVSVLTEPDYFMGSDSYLREIAALVKIPVLRKDFVVDEYQIYEAALLGAKAVLLICALLGPGLLAEYSRLAESLGLSALVEAHTPEEAREAVGSGARIVGINNRDLRTFRVDLRTTARLRPLIPPGTLVVAESGIRGPENVRALRECGVDGLLVGEALMRASDKKRCLAELRGDARA